jgi:heptosyltransferase-3
MSATSLAGGVHKARLTVAADWIAVALAASLPWSTSATSILAVAWIVVLVPTLDWPQVRRDLMTPAGILPVALFALGALGMTWADATWPARFHGLDSFSKLLVIPLLFVHFRRSERGLIVLGAFLASCVVLLALSDMFALFPQTVFMVSEHESVPVKSAPTQAGEFVICVFALLYIAIERYQAAQRLAAAALMVLALLFLANIVFVALARTSLVIMVVLVLLLGFKKFDSRGFLAVMLGALVIGAVALASSQYLRKRIMDVNTELTEYRQTEALNSSGERIEFYRKSVEFIAAAPFFGHGTGSIPGLFRQAAVGQKGAGASATVNPHNQTFAVGIQLGLVGIVILWAMWAAHALLFRGSGLANWIGAMVVVQNVVGSLFNSHLFDFAQGWAYVIGVGVAGGMVRQRSAVDAGGRIALAPRPRILVVVLRRLGDVLLTTPLIRSIRRAWPHASIDVLVFADSAGILDGNPDVDRIIRMPQRATHLQSLALVARLWRRYDLAVSSQAGDRPVFFARVAGRRAVAPVEDTINGRAKRAMLSRTIPVVSGLHRVEDILRLADALGIERAPSLVPPRQPSSPAVVTGRYAVIHAAPMFRYKEWTLDGWRALAAALDARGLSVVATGGPTEREHHYLDALWAASTPAVRRLDARLSWPELGELLASAAVFIGPDTSITHLAAACGCPTVALYGPTDPRLWGPWPAAGLVTNWAAAESIQLRGNVRLLQNVLPCMPCQLEGCERRLDSHSACLDELSPQRVIEAVDAVLESTVKHAQAIP